MTNSTNGDKNSDQNTSGSAEGQSRRFRAGDVVVGDWVWGDRAWRVHPVIRVHRHSVTVGIHRDRGGWLTTETLRWDEIRGVIPAETDLPADLDQALADATTRVRQGFLDYQQRGALAALLQIASSYILPTPVTAVLFAALVALTHTPEDTPSSDRERRHEDRNHGPEQGEEDRS